MRTAGIEREQNDPGRRRRLRSIAWTMHRRYAGSRWNWVALRGLATIAAGLLLFLLAPTRVPDFALIVAAFLAVDGMFSIGEGLEGNRALDSKSSALVLRGTTGLFISLAFVMLAIVGSYAILAGLYLLALWGIVVGSLDVAISVRRRRQGRETVGWSIAAAGALSLLFGLAVPAISLAAPASMLPALTVGLGVFLLAIGSLVTFDGLFARKKRQVS